MNDLQRRGIYRIRIKDGQEVKIVGDIMCPYSLSLDYNSRDLYWTETCTYELRTSKIDGSNPETLPTGLNQFFAFGSSVYDGHVFWTQISDQSTVDCYERKTDTNHRIYTMEETQILQDLQIVHTTLQPSSKPYTYLRKGWE